ncbi:MAG: sulfatase [Pirellulales bacterium]
MRLSRSIISTVIFRRVIAGPRATPSPTDEAMLPCRPLFAVLVGAAIVVPLVAVPSPAGERTHGPNIILMLADDQGWNGTSVAMHPDLPASRSEIIQTPNLERLAARGMRFSNAYAPAPVCSPTRISLQTGKSPARLHWTKAAPPEPGHKLLEPTLVKQIADTEVTIGELLRSAGYATAHYGKWHIAGGGPGRHGYDEHDGDTGNEQASGFTDPNPVDIFGMARRAEAFMDKNRRDGRPFFIQLSWNALHAPGNALRATLAKYAALTGAGPNDRRTTVAAISEDLDTGVGMVLDAVERLGLVDDTIVIYTSDNGAGGGGDRRAGLGGGKGSVWEGGIRVPFVVRGPGIAANSWCHVPVVGYDLLPTFCEWAGVPADSLPHDLDGGSIAAVLTGAGAVKRPREELVFHFPHYQSGHAPHSAIRVGDLKLLQFYEDDSLKLFDLAADIGEQRDLAPHRVGDAAELRDRLERHLAALHAQLPTVNPQFDPNAPAEPPRRGGKGGMKGGRKKERP